MLTRFVAIAVLSVVPVVSGCLLSGSSENDGNNVNNANNINNANNDPDPALCGNGVRDPGETCDPCDTKSCPTEGCTVWEENGSRDSCTFSCIVADEITACQDGDSCCPEDCAGADGDCSDLCGNGVVDEGETCDPCPDTCEGSFCMPTRRIGGDPSTCDLDCVPDQPPDECCGDVSCPAPMVCDVTNQCVEPVCADDLDCEAAGVNARCVDGTCIVPQGCMTADECLPWEDCSDVGSCVEPETCGDAPNQRAYCARQGFEPGGRTQECLNFDPSGLPECTLYMPIPCDDDETCEEWETCGGANESECFDMKCCTIPATCRGAREPNTYCQFLLGNNDAVCDPQGVCR